MCVSSVSQWTRAGCPSPVLSTSGRLWLGSARSFSCLWSSPSSATTVSPGQNRGGKRPRTSRCLLRAALAGRRGCAFWDSETHGSARHSPFLPGGGSGEAPPPPFSTLREDFGKTEPSPSPSGSRGCIPSAERLVSAQVTYYKRPRAQGPLGPWDRCPRGLGQNHHGLRFVFDPLPTNPLSGCGSYADDCY